MRLRKLPVPVLAFVAGAVVVPSVAYAATGSFSSSSTTTPAVRATNSTSGLAIDASSKGTVFRSTSSGTSNGTALWLKQYSTGAQSNGLYAKYYGANNGLPHYGVYGVNSADLGAGVLGEGNALGVLGVGPIYAVASAGDLGVLGNVYDEGGGWAGVCDVPAAGGSCLFGTEFTDPTVVPVVVLTPQGDPGGTYWVSEASTSGFTVGRQAGATGTVTFGYQVVGTYSATLASPTGKDRPGTGWTPRKAR